MQKSDLHIAADDSVWDLSKIQAVHHLDGFTTVALTGTSLMLKDADKVLYGSVRWAWLAWSKAREVPCSMA